MRLYHRMLQIPWAAHFSNAEVLNRIGKKVQVLYEIKRRKLYYFGDVIRNEKYRLIQLVQWREKLRDDETGTGLRQAYWPSLVQRPRKRQFLLRRRHLKKMKNCCLKIKRNFGHCVRTKCTVLRTTKKLFKLQFLVSGLVDESAELLELPISLTFCA